MRKQTIRHNFDMARLVVCNFLPAALSLIAVIMLTFTFSSCADVLDETMSDDNMVNIGLTFKTRVMNSDEKIYVTGSEYENYIDVAGEDYRIYFFDKDNNFIASFHPGGFVKTETNDNVSYDVLGKVDASLIEHAEDFKIVMLANWGDGNYYEDEELKYYEDEELKGRSINDICEPKIDDKPTLGTFEHKSDFVLSPTNLIPFFGVREYTNKEFKSGEATLLYNEPVSLLRAMAKVEVILEPNDDGTQDAGFQDVKICHYNNRGYCAPYNVDERGDYDHNYTWDEDFVSTLHLVNGTNDTKQEDRTLGMLKTQDDEGNEMWVAYIPEYDNNGDDYCYIELKTNYQSEDEDPYKIYFANYTDGTTDAYNTGGNSEDRYDIYRNNLYRFKVKLVDGYLRVVPQEWEATFDNNFVFDDDEGEYDDDDNNQQ